MRVFTAKPADLKQYTSMDDGEMVPWGHACPAVPHSKVRWLQCTRNGTTVILAGTCTLVHCTCMYIYNHVNLVVCYCLFDVAKRYM